MKNPLLSLCCVLLFTASVFAQTVKTEANPKALAAMTGGRFSEAIEILDKDISKEKNLFASYLLRSDIKKMTGDFAGALADVNSAIAIKADDGSLYERRADVRMILRHDMKDVLADLENAVTHGSKHERVYAQRGDIRSWTGDLEGAVADLRTAIGMKPDFARAYVALSGVYRRQNDDEAAIRVLKEFISGIDPAAESTKPADGKAVIITGIER
jgi:tetratricopeptide (TPR) repeat protein